MSVMSKPKIYLLLIPVLFAASASTAHASIFYVSKTGSDSYSCSQVQSQSTPKLSISSAFACLGTAAGAGAGHTVIVGAGTYAENLDSNIPGGTSWSYPFTFKAADNATVIVKPNGGVSVIAIGNANEHHIIIDGIIFDATNTSADALYIFGPSGYIRVQNSTLRNAVGSCADVTHGYDTGYMGEHNEFINMTIHDCGRSGYDHGIYFSTANNLVEHSTVYNVAGYGLHVYGTSDTYKLNNQIFRYNRIHNCGTAAIILENGSNSQVYNNILYSNNYIGMISRSGSNHRIYNNTIYNPAAEYGLYFEGGVDNIIVRNNIVYGSAIAISNNGSGNTIDHNMSTDPGFVNSSTGDFHVRQYSSAIDSGYNLSGIVNQDIDGMSRPYGAAYDIGAYEYSSDSLAAPTNLRIVSVTQ